MMSLLTGGGVAGRGSERGRLGEGVADRRVEEV